LRIKYLLKVYREAYALDINYKKEFSGSKPRATELKRIKELLRYGILDTPSKEEFDDITKIAAYLCDVKYAQINFLDQHRQWSKSCYGWNVWEIPRNKSICTYTIQEDKYLVISDVTKDPRLKDYEYVKEQKIQFYAGVILKSSRGYNLGTLCVFDDKPKKLSDQQLESLQILARDVEAKLELRLKREQLLEEQTQLKKITTFLYNSTDIMMVVDPENLKIIEVNEEIENLVGHSPEKMQDELLTEFFPDKDFNDRLKQWMGTTKKNNLAIETKITAGDGKELWMQVIISEEMGMYYLTARNINRRKKAELKYQNIIEHTTNMFYIHDTEGVLTYVSPQSTKFLGYKPEDAMKHWTEFVTDHPLNKKGANLTDKAIATGKKQPPFELQLKKADGSLMWVEVNETPITKNGNTTQIVGTLTDITDRKKAEQNQKLLEELANQTSAAVWLRDDRGKHLFVNQEYKSLFSLENITVTGKTLFELFNEKTAQQFYNNDQNVLSSKTPVIFEEWVNTPNGKRYYRTNMFPLKNIPGLDNIIGGMAIDITDQKQREEELENSVKEKEVLLAEVHHRVKNNLAIINSLLQLEIYNADNKQIEIILSQNQLRIKTMALIHEALYSSGNFADISLKKYLGEIIESIIKTVNYESDKPDIAIEIEDFGLTINQSIPLGLLVNELVTNALIHAFPGAQKDKLTVSASEKEGEISLTVADNGIGLSHDIDIHNPDTLGLTLVDTLVNQLRGKLELNRDDGSRFTVTFRKKKIKGSGANMFF